MGKITGLITLLLLLPAMCFAQPKYCLSSGTKLQSDADTVAITSSASKLCGVIIDTNGTNDAHVLVYDDTADNETATAVLFNMTITGTDDRGGAIFPMPVVAVNGLYLDFDGCTGCSAEVYYQP